MNSRTLEIAVGIFLVAGVLSLFALAFQVSGLTPNGKGETYRVVAEFDNIGALKPRSRVTIAGVQIGEVAAIKLDPDWYVARVELDILRSAPPIPVDSTAAILTQGLLGEQYIGLSIGAEEQAIQAGERLTNTQSAIVLEELIGQFLLESVN
ncbi:MAG: outer membrane lipid asymmetry maintenance protein MlaD [Pseudomonadota bacterium]|nr:outer membrane lipid asymmetry maintenance protein MlaD [Pseudomonadota bacterium]